jgi:hypothetical protein
MLNHLTYLLTYLLTYFEQAVTQAEEATPVDPQQVTRSCP